MTHNDSFKLAGKLLQLFRNWSDVDVESFFKSPLLWQIENCDRMALGYGNTWQGLVQEGKLEEISITIPKVLCRRNGSEGYQVRCWNSKDRTDSRDGYIDSAGQDMLFEFRIDSITQLLSDFEKFGICIPTEYQVVRDEIRTFHDTVIRFTFVKKS